MYVHVPKEKRTKLDPFGRKGIFVGYNEFAKAYRIYLSGQKRIELIKDVTFEEDVAYRRSRHAESDSDEQGAPQEVLASPSPAVEKEFVEDDDPIEPTDPVDSIVPDAVPRDIAQVGEESYLGSTNIARCRGTCNSPWSISGEKEISEVWMLFRIDEQYS